MWEIIRANERKSIILFIVMAICLLALGFFIGAVFFPPDGGINGLLIAAAVWIILSLISLTSADSIFLSISKAKPVTHDVHPQLFNVVEEMKIAANLPTMPKVYIIPESAPNAFAVGINPNKSAIAVTTGLLSQLNRDELQGVIAHEMGHIINRDSKFLTLAGILMGSITLLAEVFLRGLYFSGRSRRYSSRREGGGQAQAIMMIVAIVFAVLAPILAQLLYFAISRKREYLADATSARLTRYPEGLASALEKISSSTVHLKVANKVTAPMYIINPLKPKGQALSNLSSTHPPIQKRVNILRNMMGGAAYKDYQASYAKVLGAKQKVIPSSAVNNNEFIGIRAPAPVVEKKKAKKTEIRDIGDLTRAVNGFIFAPCVCGLKVKVPPNFKKSQINCPRCNRSLTIPIQEIIGLGTIASAVKKAEQKKKMQKAQSSQPQTYTRKTDGWESVGCTSCGNLIQISPLFAGTHTKCHKCANKIQIQS